MVVMWHYGVSVKTSWRCGYEEVAPSFEDKGIPIKLYEIYTKVGVQECLILVL